MSIPPKPKPEIQKVKKISEKKSQKICPECNRKFSISQDKGMKREEIFKDIAINIIENGDLLTLDFWRGQKFNYDNFI